MSWLFEDPNRVIAVGTLIVALGTLALAGFAFSQVQLTRRSNERQLRAYVFVEGTRIQTYESLDPPPTPPRPGCLYCFVVIKNTGQTPAYDVVHWGAITVSEVTREHTLDPPNDLPLQNPADVGAGGTLTKNLWTPPLGPADIQGIPSGARGIYIYGKIWYKDAFKRQHHTTYRLGYSGNYPPPPAVGLSFCAQGNKAT